MKCPECGSDNTKRLEVIYDERTSDSRATSFLVGSGGEGVAVTAGRSATQLAQKCSPPSKKSNDWLFVPIVLSILMIPHGFFLSGTLVLLIGIVILICSCAIWFRIWRYNVDKWPTLYEDWQKYWCCLKCGDIFKGKKGLRVDSKMEKRKIFSPSGSGKSFLVGLVAGILDGLKGKR